MRAPRVAFERVAVALPRLRRLVKHPLGPQLLLVLFVGAVYRDGLWGVPRWDQLVYLYEASQFDSPLDLLAYSPSWNRTVSIGDHILYRPFLYLFLAAQHILFGRSFVLWQATGIALHATQALLLYRLLGRVSPRTPAANLVAAGLFSSVVISSETVVWHHITGYILFTVLASLSLSFLLDYLETERTRAAEASVLLALVAAFTYELGSVYCVLAALATIVSAIRLKRATQDHPPPSDSRGVRQRIRLAALLALVPVLYAAVSLADFFARRGGVEASDLRVNVSGDLLRGAGLVAYQLYFWAGAILLPSVFQLSADYRTVFLGFRWPGGPWLAFNIASAGAAAVGGVGLVLARRRRWCPATIGTLALGYAFVLAYASIVSFGRLLPRGAWYTLRNLHYAYIGILGVFVAQALALRAGGATASDGDRDVGRRETARRACRRLFVGGLGGLALVNAVETASLLADHRLLYAAPRLELLYHAERWHERNRGNLYFEVAPACPGNAPLPWFTGYLRHRVETPYFLDALYPATSWNLNRAAIGGRGARVRLLSCTDGSVRAGDILGAWESGAGPAVVRRAEGEALVLVGETGAESEGVIRDGVVFARRWDVTGTISHDRQYIFWSNGAIWKRQ
jgi:hypothetical protein